MTAPKKAPTTRELLRRFGPPSGWSGALAQALGAERCRTIKRAWLDLTAAQRADIEAAFRRRFKRAGL